jgi:hypothetical protein
MLLFMDCGGNKTTVSVEAFNGVHIDAPHLEKLRSGDDFEETSVGWVFFAVVCVVDPTGDTFHLLVRQAFWATATRVSISAAVSFDFLEALSIVLSWLILLQYVCVCGWIELD